MRFKKYVKCDPNIFHYITILISFIIMGLLFYRIMFNTYMFGTTLDWVNQHVAFAKYFRGIFYEYGTILPQFSFHIGAGQNIFNFAYHGLLNPLIMLSYFLPWIAMENYISLLGFSSFVLTGFFMYYWLIKNNYPMKISLCVSLIIMFSGPITFHAHRHYMFISYMPFMLIAMMGIDYYYKKKIKFLFIIGNIFSILTSFYYAPSFSVVFFLYAIYKYLLMSDKFIIRDFIKSILSFLLIYIVGILVCAILIIPVILTIIQNRASTLGDLTINQLFQPFFNPGYILYGPYNMGLIIIMVVVLLINLFNKYKSIRFLSISLFIILTIPIFIYILNGMLYFRPKVLIPFIPLFGLLLAHSLDKLKEYNPKYILIILFLFIPVIIFEYNYRLFNSNILLIDLIATSLILVILMYNKTNTSYIMFLFPLIMVSSSITENQKEHFLTKEFYNSRTGSSNLVSLIKETLKNDQDFYRFNNLVYNTYYTPNSIYDKSFYNTSIYSSNYSSEYHNFLMNEINISHSSTAMSPFLNTNNILFQTFMGVKYITAHNNKEGIGYNKIKSNDNIYIAKNNNIFPIGFSNSKTLSYEVFSNLNHPQRQEALLNYIITNDSKGVYLSNVKNYELKIKDVIIPSNLKIKKIKDIYIIDAKQNTSMTIKLDEPINNNVLFIEFDVINDVKCTGNSKLMIGINKIDNTLSCKSSFYYNNNTNFNYAISSPKVINELNITFYPGTYKIGNIKLNILSYDYIKNSVSNIDKLIVDRDDITTNSLKGNIDVKEDGWFTFTIPYDKGFKIILDGKQIEYKKVNTSFIGFPISKGYHKLELIYQSPGLNLGIIITSIGILLLTYIIGQDYYRLKRCKL